MAQFDRHLVSLRGLNQGVEINNVVSSIEKTIEDGR